jgi:HD-GYP domain-containing protein (c-di-GMP phosphodiesterase class II)
MTKNRCAPPAERPSSLATKAKALAVVLPEEFGVPFVFYEAARGVEVLRPDHADRRTLPDDQTPDAVARLAAERRGSVTALADGRYQLAVVLFENSQPLLVGVAVLPTLAAGPDRQRELERLRRWAFSVGDRLRLNDLLAGQRRTEEDRAAHASRTWEVLLGVDSAIRGLRIHKNPDKNRKDILKTAQGFLGAQTVAWVPGLAGVSVLIQGEACLAPADFRLLAATIARSPDCQRGKPVTWNREQAGEWAQRFPQVQNLLAFPVTDQQQEGWLLALNKRNHLPADDSGTPAVEPFRRSDAAILMPFAALFELQLRGSRRFQELKELMVGLARSLTATVDAKDTHTYGHSERVARIAVEIGREMGLQEEELSDIYLAGLLHDVGKIGIRDDVLMKPGSLTDEEYNHVKQHVVIGYRILAELHPLRNLLPAVLHHHERYDGKGYPDGLAGETIPLLARILAVADAFDAMSARRTYRNALSPKEVEETLREGAGTHWDKRVVEAFLRCRDTIHLIRQRGVGESLQRAIDGALRAGESLRFA